MSQLIGRIGPQTTAKNSIKSDQLPAGTQMTDAWHIPQPLGAPIDIVSLHTKDRKNPNRTGQFRNKEGKIQTVDSEYPHKRERDPTKYRPTKYRSTMGKSSQGNQIQIGPEGFGLVAPRGRYRSPMNLNPVRVDGQSVYSVNENEILSRWPDQNKFEAAIPYGKGEKKNTKNLDNMVTRRQADYLRNEEARQLISGQLWVPGAGTGTERENMFSRYIQPHIQQRGSGRRNRKYSPRRRYKSWVIY